MIVDFLKRIFEENGEEDFLVWHDRTFTYDWLSKRLEHWRGELRREQIAAGEVVVVEADYSPNVVALFLALAERAAIQVPLSRTLSRQNRSLITLSRATRAFRVEGDDGLSSASLDGDGTHPLYAELRRLGHPGLVVFSSGSTGTSKGAVHDLVPILDKFRQPRHRLRSIPFLLFDHLGGLNTLLYSLSNAGCLVCTEERTPDAILGAASRHRVELLPTSPTFLNLILLSEAYKRHDMSSLQTISYGTEPMPESTLRRLRGLFPQVRLLQTYGLSELGVLRTKSRESGSLWVKIGGEGFEWRVVEGLLEIKARSAMLGYLNAPSPFTDDGWFRTGDEVDVDGEYLRILGRRSDLINVGGQKVYPAQVESVLMEIEEITDATAYGEKNPITGNVVCADLAVAEGVTTGQVQKLINEHCRRRLKRHEIPVKINLLPSLQYRERFKKDRRRAAD